MLVIADSSALIALATCGALDVLALMYDDVRVPQAVLDEVSAPDKPQAVTLSSLIDDRRARAIAEHNHIVCIGALGVLLLAKHRALIHEVAPYVERLRASHLHYGEALLAKVLSLANEHDHFSSPNIG